LRTAILGIFTIAFATMAIAQSTSYPIPKYPPKFSSNTQNIGPRPGSKASEDAPDQAEFRRVYFKPAGLRLFVRANCDSAIGQNELIKRAENGTLPEGPTVQMDWERIKGETVTFWAVVAMEKEVVTISLQKSNGRYAASNTERQTFVDWQVQKISVGNSGVCVKEKDVTNRQIRIAVINLLNNVTLRHFRKPFSN